MSVSIEKYTECAKLRDVAPHSEKIGQFLDWCAEKGMILATYHPDYYNGDRLMRCAEPIEQLLARYFEIDMVKVEQERCQILEDLRNES